MHQSVPQNEGGTNPFGGKDGQGIEKITQLDSDYKEHLF